LRAVASIRHRDCILNVIESQDREWTGS
jgi:hypothetical protein